MSTQISPVIYFCDFYGTVGDALNTLQTAGVSDITAKHLPSDGTLANRLAVRFDASGMEAERLDRILDFLKVGARRWMSAEDFDGLHDTAVPVGSDKFYDRFPAVEIKPLCTACGQGPEPGQ